MQENMVTKFRTNFFMLTDLDHKFYGLYKLRYRNKVPSYIKQYVIKRHANERNRLDNLKNKVAQLSKLSNKKAIKYK